MLQEPASLVDILRWRGEHQPQQLAYRFLVDGETEEIILTYKALDTRARAIGALLQEATSPGDRALLLFPPGLDFIAAYFGCLYAKVLAIPVSPPHPARPARTLPIIQRIAEDAGPSVALLPSSLFEGLQLHNALNDTLGKTRLLVTDREEIHPLAAQWQPPSIEGSDIAFLQYTSGSTTLPRGVKISHANLFNNLAYIEASFGLSGKSHSVFWLPPYHDMGLIGGILQSLYTGYPVTLIPQLMFLQRPIRWLQAISRFRATCSGGPNFAYDLCVQKVRPEQREHLDLGSWEVAFNGAEPVYHKTLEKFADYFAPCGFRREAFFPCYGLAEATLMVVGGPRARLPVIRHLLASELKKNKAIIAAREGEGTRALVGCGQIMSGQNIQIVDPETHTPCAVDQIGEIWFSGPSVASGYWNKPIETSSTFGAVLSDTNEGPFLRTGDLGMLYEGELYITGRIRNLVICNGKNHYAHDIERTVEGSHPDIRMAGCAVFSIQHPGREDIIVIAELEHTLAENRSEIIQAIRQAVALHHELTLSDIRLTHPGGIPRTTSGKIRHFLCKTNYLAGAPEEINII